MNGNTPLSFYYQNVNGLRTKFNELMESVSICLHKIIILTETNLSGDIESSELGLQNYNIFRMDRSPLTSRKLSGGGVLVAVHTDFSSQDIKTSVTDVEHVFVLTRLPGLKVLIGVAYIPPNSPLEAYSHFCDAAEEAHSIVNEDCLTVIAGDFNQPDTHWNLVPFHVVAPASQCLVDMANFLRLSQINGIRNSRGVTLDLVFSSDQQINVTASDDPLLQQEEAHPALVFEYGTGYTKPKQSTVFVPNLSKCKLDNVYLWIQRQVYTDVSSCNDIEKSFSDFCIGLRETIIRNCPVKKVGCSRFPHWFSGELRGLTIEKKLLHLRYKKTNSVVDLARFNEVRRQCKRVSRQCHLDYLSKVDADLALNPKSFWNHVKSLKTATSTLSTLCFEDRVADEPETISALFAEFFSSVFKAPSAGAPIYHYDNNVSMASICVSASEVEAKLKTLDASKGPGPDDIPARVLKFCSEILAPHLAILFSELLCRGIFPACLKTGFIVPIFKAGDRSKAQNYRPIVIQSALAKVFESIVLDRLAFAFKNMIIPEQHGFQHGRSTSTNLIIFINEVLTAFLNGSQLDCVYLDYSKAFDRISHPHLLNKLHALGIHGPLLRWFRSYLTDRTLRVRYGGALSRPIHAVSGVPQGSHLGPFLFGLFINDIKDCIKGKFLLFADDVKVFSEISSERQAEGLQDDLRCIEHWCLENAMELNPAKCTVMTFVRKSGVLNFDYILQGVCLPRVNSVKDLGVILTATLDPGAHIQSACNKAVKILGLIHRTSRYGLSISSIRTLYVSLVRPVLEYSVVVWSPYQVGHRFILEGVQRRLLRMVGVRMGYRYLDVDVVMMQQFLHLPSLSSRRVVLDLVLLYKLLNGLIDCPYILQMIDLHVPRGTRHHQLFAKHQYPTNYFYFSTVPRLLRTGNEVCAELDFFGPGIDAFKKRALTCCTVIE